MLDQVWTIYEGNKPLGTYRTIGEYNALDDCLLLTNDIKKDLRAIFQF